MGIMGICLKNEYNGSVTSGYGSKPMTYEWLVVEWRFMGFGDGSK
jgi:hypothetical protein